MGNTELLFKVPKFGGGLSYLIWSAWDTPILVKCPTINTANCKLSQPSSYPGRRHIQSHCVWNVLCVVLLDLCSAQPGQTHIIGLEI